MCSRVVYMALAQTLEPPAMCVDCVHTLCFKTFHPLLVFAITCLILMFGRIVDRLCNIKMLTVLT